MMLLRVVSPGWEAVSVAVADTVRSTVAVGLPVPEGVGLMVLGGVADVVAVDVPGIGVACGCQPTPQCKAQHDTNTTHTEYTTTCIHTVAFTRSTEELFNVFTKASFPWWWLLD